MPPWVLLFWLVFLSAAGGARKPTPSRPLRCRTDAWGATRVLVVQLTTIPNASQAPDALDVYLLGPIYQADFVARQPGFDYLLLYGHTKVPSSLPPKHFKVFALQHAMERHPDYHYYVFLDVDVIASNDDQVLVCLLLRWGVAPYGSKGYAADTPFLWMARDPAGSTESVNGETLWNTGFTVWKPGHRTRSALRTWQLATFVDDRWHHDPGVYDQSTFNVHVRPQVKDGTHVIPCDEANGWGWLEMKSYRSQCSGKYLTHAWMGKWQVADVMRERLLRRHNGTMPPFPPTEDLTIELPSHLILSNPADKTHRRWFPRDERKSRT